MELLIIWACGAIGVWIGMYPAAKRVAKYKNMSAIIPIIGTGVSSIGWPIILPARLTLALVVENELRVYEKDQEE